MAVDKGLSRQPTLEKLSKDIAAMSSHILVVTQNKKTMDGEGGGSTVESSIYYSVIGLGNDASFCDIRSAYSQTRHGTVSSLYGSSRLE
ncbi:hypothetical protein Pint_33747 [Pistacia integerrima]|uniref:Uncharacterized protein n=1 Tax=Pistacia integerrima TaxID=434235 RepID=A0ACC0X4Q1_9ROSI|nr:hypothetical protein Pint_33747 [Pistacia integerrima]